MHVWSLCWFFCYSNWVLIYSPIRVTNFSNHTVHSIKNKWVRSTISFLCYIKSSILGISLTKAKIDININTEMLFLVLQWGCKGIKHCKHIHSIIYISWKTFFLNIVWSQILYFLHILRNRVSLSSPTTEKIVSTEMEVSILTCVNKDILSINYEMHAPE